MFQRIWTVTAAALPDGSRARSNGELVAALVAAARADGRSIASPEQAREALGLAHA